MTDETTTGGGALHVGEIVHHKPTGKLGCVSDLGPRSMLTIELPHEAGGKRSKRVTHRTVRRANDDELVAWCIRRLEG